MAVLEITLAIILTLLALAILAILLTRWTRRRQNEMYMSRYSSEQSFRLLDYEDGTGSSSRRPKKGRGCRQPYLTESEDSRGKYTPSASSGGLSRSSIALSRSNTGEAQHLKATQPLSSTPGSITGAIGPIMQFSAPIPGATGPIKLSQKTIVQTPGPIVQYMGQRAPTSETTSEPPPSTFRRSAPLAITDSSSTPSSDLSVIPTTKPEKSAKKQEPTHVAVPIITPIPIAIAPVAALDAFGKIVILPGYVDEELTKKSSIKAQPPKHREMTESKETLKKEVFTDSEDSLAIQKRESQKRAKFTELEKDKIGMEVKVKSDTEIKEQAVQVKKSQEGVPQHQEPQIKSKMEAPKQPQEKESQIKEKKEEVPKAQESQVKSEMKVPQKSEAQEKKTGEEKPKETAAEQKAGGESGQKAQEKKSETETLKEKKAPEKKGEAETPSGEKAPEKKGEAQMPKEKKDQEKPSKEVSENKGKEGKEKTDAKTSQSTKEKDDKNKKDEGKGKENKEAEAKDKKLSVKGKSK
ncbi:PREDICTED: uncharacterized protein C6orf10 homolog isoform X1 [Chinchilla lanigera]|uniref:uncharacterized protein C6orf10 homolog isoform X1 n=1 Tax=Chinchilla lanigera TaxID=34839 RepID=UPI0006980710|nr:PREDICTED: uncharacterized protein C6orf10 homolog isoform X1 [Chinchilla lanigera]